ncbi:MAG: NFACT family protein [Bacillus subtilis]|nr:NFACT family protein [Bacillus subtilis]
MLQARQSVRRARPHLPEGIPVALPEDGKIAPTDFAAVQAFFESRSDLDAGSVAAIRGFSPLSANHLLERAFNRPTPLFDIYREFLSTPSIPSKRSSRGNTSSIGSICSMRLKSAISQAFPLFSTITSARSGRLDRTNQMSKNICPARASGTRSRGSKMEKLTPELVSARDASRHRVAADLIIQHLPELQKGDDLLEAESYVDGSKLDQTRPPARSDGERRGLSKRYKKAKQAVAHIEEQIVLTEREIRYLDLLSTQLETASPVRPPRNRRGTQGERLSP